VTRAHHSDAGVLRYMIEVERAPIGAAAVRFGCTSSTIRTRMAAYGIVQPSDDAPIPDLRQEPVRVVRGVAETAGCGDIDLAVRNLS